MNNKNDTERINVKKVSKERWQKAQNFELELWKKSARLGVFGKFKYFMRNIIKGNLLSCYDDWNLWWLVKFDNYFFLKDLNTAIEIGCGPFSNMRLIIKKIKCYKPYFSDPLIRDYIKYTDGFVAKSAKKGDIFIDNSPAEDLPYKDNYFDLVVLINVLDHVRDAEQVLNECIRITRKKGVFIIGQDLTNEEDAKKHPAIDDPLHPISVDHIFLDNILKGLFTSVYFKLLPRKEGRNPDYHYGTYLFAGIKK
jgi:SAM-dependent methyltransferase